MMKGGVTHLGQYRLESEIGSGGMGIVYSATDETLHREVAIKVLHPHLLQNEDLKERFRREARMHAQLMHPNIVTLLSIYEDKEHMALVMEMVHGKNLREYLRAGDKHSIADLIHIAKAVLSGLETAHRIGLVHRDLKPANVLVSDSGDIKLMDFGLAKPEAGDDDLTQSGATVGSFRYMAPEQILNKPIDARTDLYAFGILLYQMMTGKLPFDASAAGGGEFEIMEKQVRDNPVPPHEVNHSISLEISDLILRLLAKNPDDRPASCSVVIQELNNLAKDLSKVAKAPIVSRPPTTNTQSNAEIAKGLLLASGCTLLSWVHPVSTLVSNTATQVFAKLPGREKLLTHWEEKAPKTWKVTLTWLAAAMVIALLGWALISVMGAAERPVIVQVNPERVVQNQAVQPAIKPVVISPATPVQTKKTVQQSKQASVVTPVKSVVKPKPQVKHKRKPRRVAKSITYKVGHKLIRQDGSKATMADQHEFKGGSRLFFEALKDYRGKGAFIAYKKGQLRLYLDKPVTLRKIIIHKASVGRLSFKGGYIKLAVQDSKHKWHKIFERDDDDVDIAVTISKQKLPATIIGARLRFRSPEPITIGPIDLIP